MMGVTPPRKLRKSRLSAALYRRHWVAQERFSIDNIGTLDAPAYPCVGVYTLGTRVIGAYGRVSQQPIIDMDAQDAPVFVTGRRTGGSDELGRTVQ